MAAAAAGCVNWGFPTIADTDIPEILPTGICTYEHVVANVTHEEMVQKSVEVRGLKTTVSKIEIPCAFGPAFEGERVRGADLYCQSGGGKTQCTEYLKLAEMNEIEDGKVTVIGRRTIGDMKEGDTFPLAIMMRVAGREFQEDFEPILERQTHPSDQLHPGHHAHGPARHRLGACEQSGSRKRFTLKDIGVVLHAKFHQDFGKIMDKAEVVLYTKKEDVDKITAEARAAYKHRDERVENMTDEDVDIFYSCTLCQSFAPTHVCAVSPERTGLCGAYNWMDCKASYEINPTGPNQPIEKGEVVDPVMGRFAGVDESLKRPPAAPSKHTTSTRWSTIPMTTCGCCEAIAAMLPACNGVMTVNREYAGETPCGMKFTTWRCHGRRCLFTGFCGPLQVQHHPEEVHRWRRRPAAHGVDAQNPQR